MLSGVFVKNINEEEDDNGLKEGGFMIFVTIIPKIYRLAFAEIKLTLKVKLLIKHERLVTPVRSVQTESIENSKILGKLIIKILEEFNNAF